MSKHFRPWKLGQAQLLPPSVLDYVPEDHLSRFIVALVTESLDLSAIAASYRGYWVASSGNVTDEVWAEYIKNQTPPEPDDDFNVT